MMIKQDTMQVLSLANKANVDTMQSFAEISFKAAERLLAVNMGFAKASLNLCTIYTEQVPFSDWNEISPVQNATLHQATETLANYLRQAYEVTTETQADVTEIITCRVCELNDSMTTLLDTLVEAIPVGSETAMAAIKAAIIDSNSAYNEMVKSAQHAALTTQPVKNAKQVA